MITRLAFVLAAGFAFSNMCTVAAHAECAPAPAAEASSEDLDDADAARTMRIHRDSAGRAVAPVYINDTGPFRFIVDTGANRSVLSSALARRLGVTAHGQGEVHTIDSIHLSPIARVDSLSAGGLRLEGVDLPLLDSDVLAGEHGFLGVDGLTDRRLLIDFDHRCVEIIDARTAPALSGWIAVRGRLQFGSSFVMRGWVRDMEVAVLVDTGSNISLGNIALRDVLHGDRARMVERHGDFVFTAGRPIVYEDTVWAPRVRVGTTSIGNVTAYIGDFHIFDMWGLRDTPTLLIGVDVLAQAGAVAIDYAAETIYFRRRPHGLWH